MERNDEWYRLQGRLNALKNLLILLVLDRAAVNQDPATWIAQYVANLRSEKKGKLVGPDRNADLDRVLAETHKAVNEIADLIEQHGAIFKSENIR